MFTSIAYSIKAMLRPPMPAMGGWRVTAKRFGTASSTRTVIAAGLDEKEAKDSAHWHNCYGSPEFFYLAEEV